MADPVCIRTFENRTEAEFVKQFLDSEGITSTIWADDYGGLLYQQPSVLHPPYLAAGVRLYVPAEDANRAEACLSRVQGDRSEDAADRASP